MYDGDDVRIERRGAVAVVTLARPPVNALRTRTWTELGEAFRAVEASVVRVVVLRSGVPGIFSAGADVKELPMAPQDDERRMALSRRVLNQVVHAPQPVISVVDGPALGGGCALAAAADIRVGSTRARFGLPELDVARCGGARHLMRHLGQGPVRLLYFTGQPMDAGDAYRLGLLAGVHGDPDAAASELAATIAGKSPVALRLAKQSLNLVEMMDVDRGYEVEQQFSLRLARTPDAAEAIAARREQRPPVWSEVTVP